jgi:hypothetical protein
MKTLKQIEKSGHSPVFTLLVLLKTMVGVMEERGLSELIAVAKAGRGRDY